MTTATPPPPPTSTPVGFRNGAGSSFSDRGEGPSSTAEIPSNDAVRENAGGAVSPAQRPQPDRGRPHRQDTGEHPNTLGLNRVDRAKIISRSQKKKKNVKAHVKIATQNMNGRTFQTKSGQTRSKWLEIHRAMREYKVGILALQETHLTEEELADIQVKYAKSYEIFNSHLPDNPTGSAGVGFVLNKGMINTNDAHTTPLIEGRAALLEIKWNESETLRILNVYAPNAPREHLDFWVDLEQRLKDHNITQIDYLLGDFNLVEDARDRAPQRPDDERAVEALREFRQTYDLIDAWRNDNEKERVFTYRHTSNQRKSRLDRIYTTKEHSKNAYKWEVNTKVIYSDHDMVSVKHSLKNAPHIGKGRWTWPIFLIEDKKLISSIVEKGKTLEGKLRGPFANRQEENPQVLWQDFKDDITKEAKKVAKAAVNRIATKLKKLREEAHRLANDPTIDDNEEIRREEALIVEEIEHLEKKRRSASERNAQARWQVKGESVGKYWTKAN
ncbi:DNase I-like protein, partial [Auriscalpium vulgare]